VYTFPHYIQNDSNDCGPSCLRMIMKYYGKSIDLVRLREMCFISREGVSLLSIAEAAETFGFRTKGVNIDYSKLVEEASMPCIVHWNQNHFVVVYRISKRNVYVADPAFGLLKYNKDEFCKSWISNNDKEGELGICLLLETTEKFYETDIEDTKKVGWNFLYAYLKTYRKFFFQLALSLIFASIVQLILPFITQAVVDTGINNQNISFIYLALIAQMVLFISRMTVDFIRTRILMHISARINISIISDFLAKLMRLPLSFFDSKMIGDLLQRINDHERIEHFLTSQTLSVIFSFFNLIVFSVVLAIYSINILAVFVIGSVLYGLWILLFMKKRKELDYKRFNQLSQNQSNTLELIEGIQEIKLNNCEHKKFKPHCFKLILKTCRLRNINSRVRFL
jgi:ATP-binding cassette subfamily B protein